MDAVTETEPNQRAQSRLRPSRATAEDAIRTLIEGAGDDPDRAATRQEFLSFIQTGGGLCA